jgi:hypothetical protein
LSIETTPVQGTGEVSLPEDFAAYQQFRQSGELPIAEETTTSEVAAEEPAAETDADSETANDQEQEESQQERDDKGRFSKRGIQKRFHELTSKIRDLEGQIASRETGVASPEVAPAKADDSEPQVENYDDYNAYLRDLTKFTVKQERVAEARADASRRHQEQERVAFESWQAREAQLRSKHEDYDDAISELQIPATKAVGAIREFLAESEVGPSLLYHLAKNPADAERIVKLSPVRAIAEISKLEEKLSSKTPQQKTQTVTKAPPPPQTVSSRASAAAKPLREVTDFSEYESRRRKGERP